ncbi:hypothetical protein TRVL_07594 [Trypanosoma vivax]|nr:hypothetical protein TRVL_07594 [Trypanosoma vivax]
MPKPSSLAQTDCANNFDRDERGTFSTDTKRPRVTARLSVLRGRLITSPFVSGRRGRTLHPINRAAAPSKEPSNMGRFRVLVLMASGPLFAARNASNTPQPYRPRRPNRHAHTTEGGRSQQPRGRETPCPGIFQTTPFPGEPKTASREGGPSSPATA